MSTPTLSDLSFNVWYDQATKAWRARARELPIDLVSSAETPMEAVTGLCNGVEDVLESIKPEQPGFHILTGVDWDNASTRGKVMVNEMSMLIKDKSLSALLDTDELDRIARDQFEKHALPNLTLDEKFVAITSFVDGFRRGVKAALKAEL